MVKANLRHLRLALKALRTAKTHLRMAYAEDARKEEMECLPTEVAHLAEYLGHVYGRKKLLDTRPENA